MALAELLVHNSLQHDKLHSYLEPIAACRASQTATMWNGCHQHAFIISTHSAGVHLPRSASEHATSIQTKRTRACFSFLSILRLQSYQYPINWIDSGSIVEI
jgi:hypothetical protein